tara:strand:- start:288 stop:953 length:666 start_codon:yes stop_codon:yes gene_type:complete
MALTKVIGDGTGTLNSLTFGDSHSIGNQTTSDNLQIKSSSGENIVYDSLNGAHIFYKNGVENFRVNDDGEVRVTDNILLTASSKGIYLGVTSATASNLLDDFEQGTWTPTNGGNTTYGSREGLYIKFGNAVFIFGIMEVASIGTGDTREISGLPFASTRECTIPLSKLEHSSFNFHSAQLRTSGSSLFMSAQTSLDAHIAVNQNYFQNSTVVQFSGTYITS